MLHWLFPLAWNVISVLAACTAVAAQEQQTLMIDGVSRTYRLVGATPGQPRALVLALHGNLGTGAQFGEYGRWRQTAAKHGFVAVLPDGINRAWNDGRPRETFRIRKPMAGIDDVQFLTSLVARLVDTGIADKRRVYVTGASNGGMMTYRLLCDRADLFAAGAAVIANLPEKMLTTCKPSRTIPILIMNGSADKLTPEAGRPGELASVDATIAFWRQHNMCRADSKRVLLPDRDPADGSRVERYDATCPAAQPVVHYRIVGGGHQIPSLANDFAAEIVLGSRNHDIEAAEEIWSFFKPFALQ